MEVKEPGAWHCPCFASSWRCVSLVPCLGGVGRIRPKVCAFIPARPAQTQSMSSRGEDLRGEF